MRKTSTFCVVCLALAAFSMGQSIFNDSKSKPADAAKPGQATTRPAAAAAPIIVVKWARYGSDNRWADVTEECQRLLRDDALTLPRNLHKILNADPVPGFMKYVDLTLVINGVEVQMTVADNLELTPLQLAVKPRGEAK
jgi:hypothetical protein